ncbi:MAG: archaellin/type IV pilin N-terminal domain-containing protein [Nanoarchaeota archaeon]
MYRNKKAISPLIAAVLLIGFTIVLTGLTFIWSSEMLNTSIKSVGSINNSQSYSINAHPVQLKYYGYYFVEFSELNMHYLDDVSNYTNVVQIIINNPDDINQEFADRIKKSNIKMLLQVFNNNYETFSNDDVLDKKLKELKGNLNEFNLYDDIAMIEAWDEPYTLVETHLYDNWGWPEFIRLTSTDDEINFMKSKLETKISKINQHFPGIPVYINENKAQHVFDRYDNGSFKYAPPKNIDVISIDPYFNPTSIECNEEQRNRFDAAINISLNWAKSTGKPIQLVGQSYYQTDWPSPIMPSVCQMQWYYETANNPNNNILSFLWFSYAGWEQGNVIGVKEFSDRTNYQRIIGNEILSNNRQK